MCLYPRLIKNKKYEPNKKNQGIVPEAKDPRCRMIPIGCGLCFECMKKRKNEWKVRLGEDIKTHKNGVFVTLTFSNQACQNLIKDVRNKTNVKGYALDNAVAKLAVKRFLGRWRRKHKKSVRHWLVTELGHNGTERIHLHGIIFTDDYKEIERIWNNGKYKYGWVWDGKKENERRINYVNQKTINYIAKYITKVDLHHKYYKPIILCSPGIGKDYTKTHNASTNKFKEDKTDDSYTFQNGKKAALPVYWRNKIYSEEEREKLWIIRLNKEERWVGGEKVSTKKTADNYYKLIKWYRRVNGELGYGSPENWQAKKYEHERRKLKQQEIWTKPTRKSGLPSAQGSIRKKKAKISFSEAEKLFKELSNTMPKIPETGYINS